MSVTLTATPVLETERLVLRAPVAADYPVWEAFAGTERARYIGGPYSPRLAWRSFGHMVGHWVMRGFGLFVITRRGSDRPLGAIGPWFPKGWPEAEISWSIWDAEAEGQGIAFEAAARARAFAYQTLGWSTAVSYIDPPNARSIALAERLGARRDPLATPLEIDDHDTPILVFRHPVPESAS